MTVYLEQTPYKNSVLKAFRFEVTMHPEIMNWHRNAKDRLEISRRHASDYTRGNVDYHVEFSTWNKRTFYGDVILAVPKKYLEQGETWHDVAEDAVKQTIYYEWPDRARQLVTNIKVIKQIRRRKK